MKGKVSKYLLIIVPLILAGWVLWPTFRAWQLEGERESIKQSKDSTALARWDNLHGEDLRDARNSRLKLGLDLRGGMYVTLEVDAVRLLEESTQKDVRDDIFEEVLKATREQSVNSEEPVLDIFLRNFDKIARPKGRTLLSYFEISGVSNLTEQTVIEKLGRNVEEAIDQAQEVVRQRIDKFGLTEPTIQKQGTRRIVLELPGVSDEGEIRQLLQTSARLEFKLVRNNAEVVRAFRAIDEYLAKRKKGGLVTADTAAAPVVAADSAKTDSTVVAAADTTKKDTTAVAAAADTTKKDSAAAAQAKANPNDPYAGLSDAEKARRYREDHPFTSLFRSFYVQGGGQQQEIGYTVNDFPDGDYAFQIPSDNVAKLEAYLQELAVRRILTSEYEVVFAAKTYESLADPKRKNTEGWFEMFALKSESELTGDVLTEAVSSFDPINNQPVVNMSMSSEGAERWARITGANIKKRIAIVLDGRVYSAPTVQNRITGGNSQISGSRNIEEARLLAIILKAGALKAPVQIIEERVVGPSLGADQIRTGLIASAAAFALVVLFMLMYYSTGGLIADLAVLLNVVCIVALLASFGGTLTLPGIGGLILTIGMAVDANILIFERIREELRKGRSLKAAVDVGYGKAFTAILDSNVTTFITGVILFYFGTGPVQGFAITLMIGIIMTLFTAILVTRAIFNLMIMRGAQHINFGQPSYNAQS